jgi:hypothetical protein
MGHIFLLVLVLITFSSCDGDRSEQRHKSPSVDAEGLNFHTHPYPTPSPTPRPRVYFTYKIDLEGLLLDENGGTVADDDASVRAEFKGGPTQHVFLNPKNGSYAMTFEGTASVLEGSSFSGSVEICGEVKYRYIQCRKEKFSQVIRFYKNSVLRQFSVDLRLLPIPVVNNLKTTSIAQNEIELSWIAPDQAQLFALSILNGEQTIESCDPINRTSSMKSIALDNLLPNRRYTIAVCVLDNAVWQRPSRPTLLTVQTSSLPAFRLVWKKIARRSLNFVVSRDEPHKAENFSLNICKIVDSRDPDCYRERYSFADGDQDTSIDITDLTPGTRYRILATGAHRTRGRLVLETMSADPKMLNQALFRTAKGKYQIVLRSDYDIGKIIVTILNIATKTIVQRESVELSNGLARLAMEDLTKGTRYRIFVRHGDTKAGQTTFSIPME